MALSQACKDRIDVAIGDAAYTREFLAVVDQTPGTAYTQTYSTATKTHSNPTATAHTYPGSGNLFDAVAADLLINVRTDSVANAVADMVVNVKSLADNLNQAIVDIANAKQVLNSVIDDLQARGYIL